MIRLRECVAFVPAAVDWLNGVIFESLTPLTAVTFVVVLMDAFLYEKLTDVAVTLTLNVPADALVTFSINVRIPFDASVIFPLTLRAETDAPPGDTVR